MSAAWDALSRWQKPQPRGTFAKPVDVDRVLLKLNRFMEATNENTDTANRNSARIGECLAHHRGDIIQNRDDISEIIDVVQRMAERIDLLTEALGLDLEPLS